MPRVLFITTQDLGGTGGGNISTAELVRAMAALDEVDLSLIAPAPDGLSPVPESVSTYWLAGRDGDSTVWHLTHQPSMAVALVKALIRERPSRVIARIGPSMLLPPILGLLPGVRYTALVRGFVYRNLVFQRPVKAVLWTNTTLADEIYVSFKALADMLEDLGVRGEVNVVPNAVDPARFTPVDNPVPDSVKAVTDEADFVVGFVGSMAERHGLEALVDAVSALADVIDIGLVMVGDGPLRETLEAMVADRDIERSTVFTGQVPLEDVPTYIAACDVLYGISHPDKPSNPNKVYEYLACERPAITTWTPEMAFVAEEGLGVAMEAVDVESVKDALLELYETPRHERAEMGRRGREYVSEHHSWMRVVKELVAGEP